MEKLQKIIDFAVQREKEAVVFYQDLQKMVKFSNQVGVLKEFEDMERGHIEMLESFRKKDLSKIDIPVVEDLKISEYVEKAEPAAGMSYQDIIITAMKREEFAKNLYKDLADKFDDDDTKNLFLRLSAEEAKHKLLFEKIYDDEILKDN